MLEMTESAIAAMKRTLQGAAGEASGVRISLVEGGCAGLQFKLDLEPQADANDTILEYDGLPIFVDQETGKLIKGTRINYVEGLDGASYVFQNPQAEASCVCGKSFTPAASV
ncbi:MAG: iron-sulfur cluster assembly accessory protein [Defluviicoccus sp.]|nr:MAG: iron-sulfur cluster assembly accessory protein [Defluviicoccus sp.]